MPQSQLDKVVGYYVRHVCPGATIDKNELAEITDSIKMHILAEALPQISEDKLNDALQKAEEEARQYKKKLFQNIKVSIIVETIFIAFLVGIMVNQVTNLIPPELCLAAIIIPLVLCTLMVILTTEEPKE